MQLLKVSTTASLVVGPVLDSAGLEYASAAIGDISLSKNGGTLTALAATATLTYIANGHYTLAMTTGNTDTLGRADLLCTKAGYQMPPVRLTVLAATPFDTLVTNGTLASTTSGRTLVVDASGLADANAVKVGPTGSGTAQTARDLGASVLLSSGTGTGQLDFTSGVVKANATQWVGGTIPAVNVTGVPLVDAKYLLGTVFSTPTVAGIPNVNAKTWNDLATVALPLIPTTAGRTLDVSTGGEAGMDWANVGSPTTTLALTGTTIATTQKVDLETIKTNPVVNAGTVTFPTTATLASTTNITAGTVTTVTGNVSAVLADGVAHGGTPGSSTATLALKLLNVTATGFDDAVQINGGGAALNLFSGNDSDCITINADGAGISVSGGTQGVLVSGSTVGLDIASGNNNPGLRVLGAGTAAAVQLGDGSTGAAGLLVRGGSNGSAGASFLGKTSGTGVLATGGTSGAGARLVGGSSSGNGLVVVATAGDGAVIQGGDDGSNGAGLKILPGASTSEAAVQLGDGTSGAEGVKVLAGTGNTNADGVTATGAGTGVGFHSTPDAVGFGGGGTFPANFSALVIDADGRVLTDRVMFSGTLGSQALGDVYDVVLPTGPSTNGVLAGSRLRIYSGDGQYQERTITTWNGTDKIAGIDQSWHGVNFAPGDLFHILYDHSVALDSSGNVPAVATVTAITASALNQFFTLNSGQTYAGAVAGSVVKETAANAGGTRGAHHSVRG